MTVHFDIERKTKRRHSNRFHHIWNEECSCCKVPKRHLEVQSFLIVKLLGMGTGIEMGMEIGMEIGMEREMAPPSQDSIINLSEHYK